MKEVVGIQYLRAIAALAVVLFHSLLHEMPPVGKTPFEVSLFAGGVDLFFVISGFIIWSSTAGKSLQPLSWWKSRFIRIAPLYWLTLVVSLTLTWINGRTPPQVGEVVRAFLFVPTYDSQTGELAPFFVPGWTLNYEFLFYALLALTLVFKRPAVRLGCLVATLGLLVVSRRYADPANAVHFAFSSPLMFEFVAGIFVSIAYRSLRLGERDWMVGVASLALAAAMLAMLSPRLYEAGPRAIYFGVPAALIVFGVVCLERLVRQRPWRFFKLAGDSSYSLYLSHEFVLYGTLTAMTAHGSHYAPLNIAVALAVCLLFGLAVHLAVEKPLLATLRGKRRKPLAVSAVAPGTVAEV